MDTTINQRVKAIADKLCDGNISEMARIVGLRQPSLRDVVTGKLVKPGFDVLHKIVDNSILNINSEWLLKGKGEMQLSVNVVHNPPYRDVGTKAIPIYDINATANLKTLFANENTQHVLGEIKIPNAPDCDGAIYVRGDSMYPLVKSGDMVSYKQLYSIDSLISGEMYVVDFHNEGNDFLVIKYVKWEEKNASLRLISYNAHHQDMIIPVGAVRAIALIKIVIRINSMF
ncbi:MAG: S24 family peptidase [Dysgonamonadaceae bacterium]|nr:S24 family peptidase [Dysgonamonadaceae bacterium]MDD4727710.1 S24 family peptidase [Dysgonamonadaceae bacterium]